MNILTYTPQNTYEQKNKREFVPQSVVRTRNNRTELPVDAFEETIVSTIQQQDELIISAETGAGKSTRVPQYLYKAGYNVIVTQPRRLAAVSLAKHVASEMGCELGREVGYHVGGSFPENRKMSQQTGIKYCTDGLHLVQQLMNSEEKITNQKETILVIDEVHEWNQNIEVLIAWVKKEKELGKKIKVVLMSATLDAEQLAAFFRLGGEEKNDPKILSIPGRLYPVQSEVATSSEITDKTVALAQAQRNVLVFEPGKADIEERINQLKGRLGDTAIILPLHGELSVEEQDRVFKKYHKPVVIVSTNVAQTSVTIPYIDAVVDSATEKRMELKGGVETLVLGNISMADVKQRMGRAGRCKPGVYIYCGCTAQTNLPLFSVAEIQRTRLDLNYLRILEKTGYTMEELSFVHQPSSENIIYAKDTLQKLGAIDKESKVTKLGKQLVQLPVNVNEGCMILEACKHGVLDDILRIAAIKEQDGILHRANGISSDIVDNDSDLITHLQVFKKARDIQSQTDNEGNRISKAKQLEQMGISPKAYFRALEVYLNLKNIFGGEVRTYTNDRLTAEENKEGILKSITAGMLDNIRVQQYGGYRRSENEEGRIVGKESKIKSAKIVVAEPKNIQFDKGRGHTGQINILTLITQVKHERIKALAPQIIATKDREDKRDTTRQKVVHQVDTLLNGMLIENHNEDANVSDVSIKIFCNALARQTISSDNENIKEVYQYNSKIMDELQKLKVRTVGSTMTFDTEKLTDYFYEIFHNKGIVTTQDLLSYLLDHQESAIEMMKLNPVPLLIREYKKVLQKYPETIVINNKEYLVKYENGRNGGIYIQIGEDDSENIEQADCKGWFEGKEFKFTLTLSEGGTQTITNIDTYKEEKKNAYLKKQFEIFVEGIERPEPMPYEKIEAIWNIKEQSYDEKTGTLAYCGLLIDTGNNCVTPTWFADENDAIQATNTALEQVATYKQECIEKGWVEHKYNELIYQLNLSIQKLSDTEERYGAQLSYFIDRIHSYTGRNSSPSASTNDMVESFIQQCEMLLNNTVELNILEACDRNTEKANQFIQNVKNLNTADLDEHILGTYGRGRIRSHLESLGGPDFFCGTDPNAVVYYVCKVHFGECEREIQYTNPISQDAPTEGIKEIEVDMDDSEALRELLKSKFGNGHVK